MINVITDDHKEIVIEMLEESESEIRIISPFISVAIAQILCRIVRSGLKCTFITRLYLEDMMCKANSLEAIGLMIDSGIDVYAVKGLHTKLYLSDKDEAVLGSANFTTRGFSSNIELSLHLKDELVVDELNKYFDEMLQKASDNNGLVTKDLLHEIDSEIIRLYGKKKDAKNVTTSLIMYGANVGLLPNWKITNSDKQMAEVRSGRNETGDIITSMFREMDTYDQIFYDHIIWLRFVGRGDDRRDPDEMANVFSVPVGTGTWYLSTYSRKPSQVQDGDEVYLAPLTTDVKDKQQPVIIGRGHLRGFDKDNYAPEEWMKTNPWIKRYPWYCVINDCEILNTTNRNGIPLDAVLQQFGSDTYLSSFGKNESDAEVGKKHYQKAHLRLSGNAKEFIDKRFDELVKKYGSTYLVSD